MPTEPQTAVATRLLEAHGHRRVEGEEPPDDVWCAADDEPWPCPFAQNLAAIEAEARATLLAELRERVAGLPVIDEDIMVDRFLRLLTDGAEPPKGTTE